ncbi:MAG TPA: DUF2203 domain-containing protein [Chloroflexota bacterium]|nr:DUF2203 domain-containing protein [Chloroflexota bacterium]
MARYFTLEEAAALLPEVRSIVEEIVALRGKLEEAEQSLVALHWRARGNGHVTHEGSFAGAQVTRTELLNQINGLIVRLRGLGVEMKDPTIGLIDFPSRREGRVVYLCWRLGEPVIGYWHDLDAGFGGRQPL